MSRDGILNKAKTSDYEKHSFLTQVKQAFAGALSAMFTRGVTHPLDVIRIRFQVQAEPIAKNKYNSNAPKAKYTSFIQAIQLIYKEEGPAAFWKGHMAGQWISGTSGMLQFWSYEQMHKFGSQAEFLKDHPNFENFLAGAVSGCFSATVTMPFDVARTRLISQDHKSKYGLTGTYNAIDHTIKSEGIQGIFRGITPTLIQNGALSGANFMFYKFFRRVAKNVFGVDEDKLPWWYLLGTAGAAGSASTAVLYPLDFIKRRMQMQKFEKQRQTYGRHMSCPTIMNCIHVTIREEGYTGFYKGFLPAICRTGIMTALYFSIYELSKRYMK